MQEPILGEIYVYEFINKMVGDYLYYCIEKSDNDSYLYYSSKGEFRKFRPDNMIIWNGKRKYSTRII